MAGLAYVGDREGHGGIERVGRAVVELLGEHHHVDDFLPGVSRAAWVQQLPRAQRRLARLRPEVVFVDRIFFAPFALLAASFVRPRPRMVVWLHGSEVASPRQQRSKAAVLRRFDTLICSSRFTRDLVARTYAGARLERRLTVINPGVDAGYWAGLSASVDRSEATGLNVLAVGRLTANSVHKSVDRVADAVGRLRQSGHEVRLTVVGDGPDAAAFDAYAVPATHGAYRRHAAATDAELAAHYVRANVMALPSVPTNVGDRTFVEGFGLVFLEAAACGTPSIGGEQSGASDAISPGRSGELIEGSVESIVAALRRVLTGEAAASAESCRQWAEMNTWAMRRDALEGAFFGGSEQTT